MLYILCSYAFRMGDDRKVFDVAAYLEEQGRPEELSLIFVFVCFFLSFFMNVLIFRDNISVSFLFCFLYLSFLFFSSS